MGPEIQAIEKSMFRDLPAFRVGDNVRVHYRIREGEKERTQVFQGTVIRRGRGGLGSTFTVRKLSFGVGVERIFPVHSPRIEKLEVVGRGHIRRARLYYLRELAGKKARLRDIGFGTDEAPGTESQPASAGTDTAAAE